MNPCSVSFRVRRSLSLATCALAGTLLGAPAWGQQEHCDAIPGVNVASQETHPMEPNREPLGDYLEGAAKEASIPFRAFEPRGGPTTCSGNGLGLFYPFNRANTTGWTLALARGDDGSSALINLGFTFSFYGTNYTSCYINNNGNVTFGAPYSPYVPSGFPSASVPPMIAPFWADADTRNTATGNVWYKIIDSNNGGLPDTLIVTWDGVGYYNQHSDLQNTFQLVLSNFTNPVMQPGSNVCFDYDNMCWTTGDISGVNGFTSPASATTGNAVAGINKGDGVSYFQIGRFGVSGSAYDGPFGAADGVSFLDGKRFCFNTQTGNVPPVASALPSNNTYTITAGQTLNRTIQFLSPEIGQTTTITTLDQDGAVAAGLVLTPSSGNVASLNLNWPTDCSDVGTYTVIVTARDSFSPQGVTTVTLTIRVLENNSTPTVSITAPSAFSAVCNSATITGTATGVFFNSYTVEYSANPAGPWTLITTSTTPVSNGTLATWNAAAVPPGYYFVRVRAANDCGPTSTFTTVMVKCGPPVIAVQPMAQSAQEGNRLCLRVVDGSSCSAGFQWQRNGVNLVNNTRISGAQTDELMIDPAQTSDAGSYRVILTNACGSVASVAVPVTITCRADFNGGGLSVQDIFDFLNAWFAGCP